MSHRTEGAGAFLLVVPPEPDAVEFEDAVADAAAELAAVRADAVAAEDQEYFYTRVLGGVWTLDAAGVVADAMHVSVEQARQYWGAPDTAGHGRKALILLNVGRM